jgi:hypothetical protein
MGLRVRIPPKAWMSVSCECCVLLGRGLCVGLIYSSRAARRSVVYVSEIKKSQYGRGPGPTRCCRDMRKRRRRRLSARVSEWVSEWIDVRSSRRFIVCTGRRVVENLHLTFYAFTVSFYVTFSYTDRAVAQAVSRRPLTAEARVRPESVHVGFVVDKVALGQVFPRVLRFSPVNLIPPMLH